MGSRHDRFTVNIMTSKGFVQDEKGNWRPKPKYVNGDLFPDTKPKQKIKVKDRVGAKFKTNKNTNRVAGQFNEAKHYEGINQKEDDFQQDIASLLDAHFVTYEIFYAHPPNGGNRSGREGAKFKRMGVRKGLPDMLIFNKGVGKFSKYNGLAIELKVRNGEVSENQIHCLKQLHKNGWKCIVCWNWKEVLLILNSYFGTELTMKDVELIIIKNQGNR